MNTLRKRLIVLCLGIVIMMNACGWLDKAITTTLDEGFGNKNPCSGLVCNP
jgi:hypothetical protein